ncbi:Particulate methane monooxygenase subunit C, PmoC2 protein [Oceanococcus atlanticus]|uniref:Particulate methane monooxygenase subunit C, PmoC2 protein n=1 Tax=Oceanococcus atlanticus TaxID=1317117 RepID=A0A1Y1SE49_9GAMM|nr:methane monooxygenase/ammonia monooxygenase subunit C [Oceanococcus atlanticus]ORE86822.1 Particulate methane monooxygenase subunit C, PmoC2 protein [Oceanococcus atlanticus]RZO83791.1 MAG: methane monooxygenase/ammonia monooxygenase subunit C [Oceanococcus sp.]
MSNHSYIAPEAPWAKFVTAAVGVGVVFLLYRVYQHATAFTVGLDYFSPEFQKYWMTLLYVQLPVLTAIGCGIAAWLIWTRDRNLDELAPAEELRRYLVLLSMILMFGLIAYLVASPFTEADAAWHQVTVRDTDFTPTHITLFYFGIPCFIISAMTSFLYARTRLPEFANRLSVSFAIVVAGPIMIMPNLGLNEWGHTFFYAEELFAAPIHWGFVLLGWSAFAAGGLLVQILRRMTELSRVIGQNPGKPASMSH